MKKSGAWLVRYGLEQVGVRYTFGIPGVHNTEIYDELNKSAQIEPLLVTHEAGGAFMADAIGRVADHIAALVIVPAAGAAYASAGIGEAFLDGVPMLVISGGTRTDTPYRYQLHEMDQLSMMRPICKQVYKIETHAQILPTIYEAYQLATSGEPGPVFIEVPVNVQLFTAELDELPEYEPDIETIVPAGLAETQTDSLQAAIELLTQASKPGIFAGWGARFATEELIQLAELLNAPVATTLQGLSVFPAHHPLHTGMGFGDYAVPAAANAFRDCDCMLAVGTRFGEIATGSFGVKPPQNLIHIDINPDVFNTNYPATLMLPGDAQAVLQSLLSGLSKLPSVENDRTGIAKQIARDKKAYADEWRRHNSAGRVNPFLFFESLRTHLADDDYVVVDDGNHTFLTAELMPIHKSRHLISPTDFNCMGYAVPAVIGTKLAHPQQQVVGIIGDGAFMMTCMEILTAATQQLGAVFFVFHDGELAQIAQAQEVPYNRKTCTVTGSLQVAGVARATGSEFLAILTNADIDSVIAKAMQLAADNQPVIVDVNIDYSKATRFTKGIIKTNLKRFDLSTKARFIGRAVKRKLTG